MLLGRSDSQMSKISQPTAPKDCVWKDASSYSKSDKERIPNTWVLNFRVWGLTIHRHVHYSPDVWLMSCHSLGISQREIGKVSVEEAQAEALRIARLKLQTMLKEIGE